MPIPARPKIYHIVHWDRLPSILADGALLCDAQMIQRALPGTTIGMGSIKQRRLALPVDCHPGTRVGEYVPFYFCSRSIMLFVIHCANNPDLGYRGGQGPIIHLEADLYEVLAWAEANDRRWAFTLSNAGAVYAQFRSRADQLGEVNWDAVANTDFRSADVKEAKQAEFLMYQSFPWELFSRIGVRTPDIAQRAADMLANAAHRPPIQILPGWYY
jgi:hypothetical protein